MAASALFAPAASPAEDVGAHYLHPATLFTAGQPHVVTTVLGTCVSVCLWDRVLRIGGINHYMLPLWNGTGLASPKFGSVAVPLLIERMEKLGSRRGNLVAKLFGGKASGNEHALLNIGERNAELAEELLQEARIEVAARSLGGPFGRKLIFNTGTNEVLMKKHAMT